MTTMTTAQLLLKYCQLKTLCSKCSMIVRNLHISPECKVKVLLLSHW